TRKVIMRAIALQDCKIPCGIGILKDRASSVSLPANWCHNDLTCVLYDVEVGDEIPVAKEKARAKRNGLALSVAGFDINRRSHRPAGNLRRRWRGTLGWPDWSLLPA